MDFKALIQQIITLMQNLNKKQKAVMLITLIAVIAFLAFLIIYGTSSSKNQDGYAVLFEGISAKDSSLIVEQLKKDNVKYVLKNENTILVEKENVYSQRIKVASMGLPANSKVGFELFDKQEFGATDFDQKVKFLRAIEGELAQTIESLKPISEAKVHIALPKESVFVSKQIPPSASVIINMLPNMILTPKQINGVKNLVASSIPKLSKENVTVVNSDGEALGENDEFSQATERAKVQLKYKRSMEKAYEEKIIKLLSPLLGGESKVVAKVTVDYDFSQTESMSESFSPDTVVRSEQVNEEKREGYRKEQLGGVPGAVSNIGPVQGLDEDLKEKYQKSQTTTNFEISKTTSNIKGEFATLKRVTAAVVVDGRYQMVEDDTGSKVATYVALNANELEQITNIVRKSIGYSQARGDEVAVSNFEFNPEAIKVVNLTQFEKIMKVLEPYMPFIKYILAAIILFVFYNKVIVPFGKKMLEIKTEEEEDNLPQLESLQSEQDDTLDKYNDMKKKVEKQLGISDGFSENDIKFEILQEKLRAMIEEKPEDAAILLKSLIKDEMDLDMDSFSKGKK